MAMSERGSDTNRDPQRWMHSMHVDAFFEYLLGNSHPYWTEIPSDPNPIREGGRDGVAAEDDMALRSLLPHIRPRRGRKRPDDESSSRSPSQKPKMEPGNDQNNPNATASGVDQQQLDLWAAVQPAARSGTNFFAQDQFTRMDMDLAAPGPQAGETFGQTPITAQSYTTMTPATAGAYWPEQAGEPKPSTTPTKPKTNRRHGAKVVSSAWRSGGPGGSGKIRGRPPLNRQTSQTHSQGEAASTSSFSSFPSTQSASPSPAFMHTSIHQSPHMMDTVLQQHSMMTPRLHNPAANLASTQHRQQGTGETQHFYNMTGQSNAATQSRNLRHTKSRLSLQVPERTGAEVRLATPHGQQHVPEMMVNGAMTTAGDQASIMSNLSHHQSLNTTNMGDADVHMIDPFGASAATQDMYNMLYQHQQAPQHSHHQQQHQHSHQVQSVPQGSQNPAPLFSNTMTSTQHIAATAAHHHPASPPPTTLFHHPTPVSGPDSIGADTRPILQAHSHDVVGNRTNLDALEALLTYELLGAEWTDAQGGHTTTSCSVDEAGAVAREIVDNARRVAGSAQGFLMNIAAIAGVTWLKKADERVRVQRMGIAEGGKGEVYDVHWELQLGDVKSGFSLREIVAQDVWGRRKEHGKEGVEEEDVEKQQQQEDEEGDGNAARWRSKYQGLLRVVREQNGELSGIRQSMIDLCRPPQRTRRSGESGEVAD